MDSGGRFDGKTAFVTGAASGLGKAFVNALSDRGCAVVVADIDGAAAAEVAGVLQLRGGRAMSVPCDVADVQVVAEAVESTVAEFGGVDILINNAGLHGKKYNAPLEILGISEVRKMFDVNVMGVINCSLACRAPMASRGGGVILNISSIGGYEVKSSYGVSKLAVRGLTVLLAHEFQSERIRVNAIAPGLIATDVIRAEFSGARFERIASEEQLVHRTGEVDDIVGAMLYLCSDESSFVTAETLRVAGGRALSF
ncbi:SDR family NAD(P)-dependent oxidoreductase [Rhodococcus wratislaviensis]|uniref:SDR family NAD(P)-dependent oxidoreductase n=1 Tax=Rhodococcus wratislaviensis TaxID=44752 RepID=UPI003663FA3E